MYCRLLSYVYYNITFSVSLFYFFTHTESNRCLFIRPSLGQHVLLRERFPPPHFAALLQRVPRQQHPLQSLLPSLEMMVLLQSFPLLVLLAFPRLAFPPPRLAFPRSLPRSFPR